MRSGAARRRADGRGGRGPFGFAAQATRTLVRTGVLGPLGPRALRDVVRTAYRYGPALPTMLGIAAARYPDRPAVIDEHRTITYAELRRHAEVAAAFLYHSCHLRPGDKLGIMCRNHAGFAIATLGGAAIGVDLVFLNTDFAGPQLAEALRRERVAALFGDSEFNDVIAAADFAGPRVLADEPPQGGGDLSPPPATRRASRIVMLTSGTTGTPKGAPRDVQPLALAIPAIGMVDAMRLRSGDPLVVLPPLFHGFGLAYWTLALALGSPIVLCRRFTPEAALKMVSQHRAAALFGVPVMLQRMLAVPRATRLSCETSSLKAIGVAGAPLRPDLATALLDEFGDVVFNLYGSTETGWSTFATPADLRAAPGTIGLPAQGVTVRVLGPDGRRVPPGQPGTIHVGSRMTFSGYSGGGGKSVVDGLMSTGDLGHADDAGRLFVDGREDDMIVSGGENVFPQEVEELLARHADVTDVAVFGVPDDEFGQRLAAHVVPAEGAAVDADDLRAYVRSNLARYKVPRDVVFTDHLPRNATGKVLTRYLKEN
ncbi:AMP-binding protein [Cryptosporangium aurantiacum]|uniref:Fatty-acyl-CoA synthase n=1 Tax=Cryptosporangium aurantiacum TaxID=134849 RepID=A0A1M7RMY1_9ACTN|nr:AMP-binding protein [Cryptosporangium aurantiacum]SHN47458.1 fatty-acyl-CoA synthase [Cryptosporangium aurantiacum]